MAVAARGCSARSSESTVLETSNDAAKYFSVKRPFEEIVTEHADAILRVCRSYLGLHDAEDAWADTFLSALRNYGELDESSNIEAWLVTIARNKCIDTGRARARRAVPSDISLDATSSIGAPGSGLELWDSVARLPEKQKATIALHFGAGLPYDQVAVLIGGTAAAARRSAADGIASLRTEYLPTIKDAK